MKLTVTIPKVLPPKQVFVVSVTNAEGAKTVDVTLDVRPKGAAASDGRAFSLDDEPPRKTQPANLPGHDQVTFTVSDWGTTKEGDKVVVTFGGVKSNEGVVVDNGKED